ncbi:ornithine cyclodeaminase family protein [Alteribacillus iranensis]|uniref:Ornithine cyclodeaminase/alanine dehydrogenase n=1 Tax=Alteribacillus iranensis TaxID=930128 RepID=A0A1I2DJJ8_9BACI|nr:ornithine cyclodeaminase family protein [Alteribacillus iranensis]SFE80481.1 ornithine cyclodeaminase/alanine dehydrogenase [Alteribacillus iranensis]
MSTDNKEVNVTWLSQEECIESGAKNMDMILEYVEKVNLWLAEGKVVEPELLHLLWEEGNYSGKRIGVHAALIRSEEMKVAAVKGIPSNPLNPIERKTPRSNGMIILYNEDTGYPFAVMDDTIVSALRTGASSALGAKYCARPDSEVLGLVGCGVIQNAHIEATSRVMKNIKTVRLYDVSRERAENFAERWKGLGYKFEICDDVEKAVAQSDIVYTATNVNLGNEYIPKEWIKKGSFHSGVSMWDHQDEAILEGFNKYCMDYKLRLNDEKYPLSELTRSGQLNSEDIIELGSVIEGKSICREHEDDSVFFVTLGICATDTANSYKIYQNATERGLGTNVKLWSEPAMF